MEGRLWPYLAPYGALLALAELGRWLPSLEAPLLVGPRGSPPLAARGVAEWRVPGAARRPQLAGVADVVFGLALAALWLGSVSALAGAPARRALRSRRARRGRASALAGLRLLGFVLVSPLVEELFVRSFLHRAAEAWPGWRDFFRRPVARPAAGLRGDRAVVHAQPRAVGMVGGGTDRSALNLWLYRRRRLASVWLAHAVTNGAIAAARPARALGPAGVPLGRQGAALRWPRRTRFDSSVKSSTALWAATGFGSSHASRS